MVYTEVVLRGAELDSFALQLGKGLYFVVFSADDYAFLTFIERSERFLHRIGADICINILIVELGVQCLVVFQVLTHLAPVGKGLDVGLNRLEVEVSVLPVLEGGRGLALRLLRIQV